eukprot:1215466-Rhodomonas_salina.1
MFHTRMVWSPDAVASRLSPSENACGSSTDRTSALRIAQQARAAIQRNMPGRKWRFGGTSTCARYSPEIGMAYVSIGYRIVAV